MPFLYASVAALLAIKEARIVRFYKWNCCFTSKLKLTFSNNNWGEQRTSGIFCTAEKPWIWWCPRSINSLWGCCVRGVDDSLLLDIPLCHFVLFFIAGKQRAALCNLMAKRHELVSLYSTQKHLVQFYWFLEKMRLDDIAVFVLHVHYKKLGHFLRHLGQIRCFTLDWNGLAFYKYAC